MSMLMFKKFALSLAVLLGLAFPALAQSSTGGSIGSFTSTSPGMPCSVGSGATPGVTCGLIFPPNSYSANHTVVGGTGGDMSATMQLTGTATLTIPAISSTVFAAGMVSCYQNEGTGTWTISSTPTIDGLASTSVGPGMGGCLSSDGTALHWLAGAQGASTTQFGVVKPDGTTITATGGVLSASAGSSGLTLISTQTASGASSIQWTGLTAMNYQLVCWNLFGSLADYTEIELGTGAGPTWDTTVGHHVWLADTYNTGSSGGSSPLVNSPNPNNDIGWYTGSYSTAATSGSYQLIGLGAASTQKVMLGKSIQLGSTSYAGNFYGFTTSALNGVVTGIRIIQSNGSSVVGTVSGTCSLFSFAN